jgi:hypothetical protein
MRADDADPSSVVRAEPVQRRPSPIHGNDITPGLAALAAMLDDLLASFAPEEFDDDGRARSLRCDFDSDMGSVAEIALCQGAGKHATILFEFPGERCLAVEVDELETVVLSEVREVLGVEGRQR